MGQFSLLQEDWDVLKWLAQNLEVWECVNNAWSKMTKYYQLTDKSHQIYAAVTFLNPTQRRDSFDNAWGGKLQP
jgi:hypothetical protein